MNMLKLSAAVAAVLCSTIGLAGGPPKITDLGPQPFQILLTSNFTSTGGHNGTSDEYLIDEDKTAVLQYVTCRAEHGPPTSPPPSNDINFRLRSEVVGGSVNEVTILAGDLEYLETLTPSPTQVEASFDFIYACIGKMCTDTGDGRYVSLLLDATRDVPGAHDEQLDCLITGYIY